LICMSTYETKELIYERCGKEIGFYCNVLLSVSYFVLQGRTKKQGL
jgi:hypothetical protein